MYTILVVDDEVTQRETLSDILKNKSYKVFTAESYDSAVDIIKSENIDLILSDLNMPGKSGLDLLKSAKEINPLTHFIIITAYGNVDNAVEIMKTGAFDFLQKPIDLGDLFRIIDKAKERTLLISENQMLKKQLNEKYSFSSIISNSRDMELVLNTAVRVADSKASIMIRGESGTGKELIARAIHFSSKRIDKPFIVVNCAAFPETLFESELFGHEKGAFTGADKLRIGKFEQADGGTLFIDEVGDIPLSVQVKLLRAVQFGEIERIGSKSTIHVDVRIITATNKNLEEMIKSGEFREDLYYRFNVVEIKIPALRFRKSDIPPLVEYFIKKYSEINDKIINGISKEALNLLIKYDFPGNIRELENIIQRAVVLTRSNIITTSDLPDFINSYSEDLLNLSNLPIGDLNKAVENIEYKMIKDALDKTDGNQVKAAELLNISERTIRYKIQKLGIKK